MCDILLLLEMNWSDSNKDDLIERWGSEPCLYDISNKDYRDNTKRTSALKRIVESLELDMPGLSVTVRFFKNII